MFYSLRVRHHGANRCCVGCVDFGRAAQLTFVLGGFLGQDMTLERLRAFDASAGADRETLGCATLGFHLGHDCSLSYDGRCFPVEKLDNPHATFYRGTACCIASAIPLLPKQLESLFKPFLNFDLLPASLGRQ